MTQETEQNEQVHRNEFQVQQLERANCCLACTWLAFGLILFDVLLLILFCVLIVFLLICAFFDHGPLLGLDLII